MTKQEQNLRLAWAKASGDRFAARLARKSLEASASQDPELASVMSDIQNESQSESYEYETPKEDRAYSDGCSYGYSEGLKDGVKLERERITMKFYALQVKARHESLSAEEKDWRAAEIEQVIREGTI